MGNATINLAILITTIPFALFVGRIIGMRYLNNEKRKNKRRAAEEWKRVTWYIENGFEKPYSEDGG